MQTGGQGISSGRAHFTGQPRTTFLAAHNDNANPVLQKQFVNHFSGCQMCLDLNKNGDMPECEREYIKSFEYANSVMMKVLARKPPRNLTMHDSILASFYCQVKRKFQNQCPQLLVQPCPLFLVSCSGLHRPLKGKSFPFTECSPPDFRSCRLGSSRAADSPIIETLAQKITTLFIGSVNFNQD